MTGMKDLSQAQIEDAIENFKPHKVIRQELGGGIIYKCPWLTCGETLYKWFRFCPKCGVRLDWQDAYVDDWEKMFFENMGQEQA